MPPPNPPLPQDVDVLQAMVRQLQERVACKDDRIKQLARQLWGRKSERQREPKPVGPHQPHGRGGRHPVPAHLRTRKIILDLPKAERKGMVIIRREMREHLEYEPADLIRVRYIVPVYADPRKRRPPRKAHVPPRVIPQASVGPGLLAKLLVGKYGDHLPLARQSAIIARKGVKLARQKLCHWVQECAKLLFGIYRQLVERVQRCHYILADETPVPVRDRLLVGKAKTGYFWVYQAPQEKAVVFDFHLTRHRSVVERFIPRRWAGELVTDGYAVYQRLAKSRPYLIHFGCNYHARRKVHEAKEHGERHPAVLNTLADYAALAAIEERGKTLTDEQRAALRGRECPPIFARMKARYEQALTARPVKRRFRKAAQYALGRWTELTRYAAPGYGHAPLKTGFRNYHFLGNAEAGQYAGILYTIIGTCALLHVNPEAYLAWVLPRLAEGTNQSTTHGLLPHDYAAMLVEHRKSSRR